MWTATTLKPFTITKYITIVKTGTIHRIFPTYDNRSRFVHVEPFIIGLENLIVCLLGFNI